MQKKFRSGQKPRIVIHRGLAGFRSRPLPKNRAENFARMTSGNDRYSEVKLLPCTNSDCWFVFHAPADEARQEKILTAIQSEQEVRGAQLSKDYTWTNPHYDKCRLICATVVNPKTQAEYTVTANDCTCPQFEFRLRQAGMICKHSTAFAEFASSQRLPAAPW